MTINKQSLLPEEAQNRMEALSSPANPIQLQQKRHDEAVCFDDDVVVPEMQFSETMKMTGSNTLAINSGLYYTEIPFTAIHGMQTRPNSESSIFEGYDVDYGTGEQKLSDYQDLNMPSISEFTTSLLIATIANSASQFLVGYNIAVLNALEKYIFEGHSTMAWACAVASLAIGAPFGAIIGGNISDSFGRKWALVFNAFGFLVGGLLQSLASSLQILTLARFVLGIMSGVATVLVPIYLGELAPPKYRGMLGTVNQFALVVGILVADLLSFPLANENGWRYLFAFTPIVAIFQISLLPFVCESPRFLLHHNPRDKSANDVLKRLRGYTCMEDTEVEVDTYLAIDAVICAPTPKTPHRFDMKSPLPSKKKMLDEEGEGTFILWEMVTFPNIRFLFFCSVALHIGQQLCGVAAVFYYSTSLFEEIMNNPLIGTTSIGAINVLFTYVALLLMDSCRRKSLVLWSVGGMIMSCTGLILCQSGFVQTHVGVVSLLFVNAYVAFYAIGLGCIPFLWIAEMVEPRYVAMTMAICSTINWLANFVVGLVFPIMKEHLGGLTFVPFAVVLVCLYLFVWIVLPENRSFSPPFPSNHEGKKTKPERIR